MARKRIMTGVLAAGVMLAGGSLVLGAGEKVLVMPFTALNLPDSQQWISKAVQEDIVADFGHNGGFSPVAYQAQVVVEDNATAARLGKAASVPLVVRGSAQQVGSTIRLTAQLIDTGTGDTVSTAIVTGPAADLLKLEDNLSQQLRGVQTVDATPASTSSQSATQAPMVNQQSPQIVYVPVPMQQPQPIYYTPSYGSPYGYYDSGYSPYYGYGSGYAYDSYPSIVYISPSIGFGFRGGFHRFGGGFGRGGGGFHTPFPAPGNFGGRSSFGGSFGGGRSMGVGTGLRSVGFSGGSGFSGGHHR